MPACASIEDYVSRHSAHLHHNVDRPALSNRPIAWWWRRLGGVMLGALHQGLFLGARGALARRLVLLRHPPHHRSQRTAGDRSRARWRGVIFSAGPIVFRPGRKPRARAALAVDAVRASKRMARRSLSASLSTKLMIMGERIEKTIWLTGRAACAIAHMSQLRATRCAPAPSDRSGLRGCRAHEMGTPW